MNLADSILSFVLGYCSFMSNQGLNLHHQYLGCVIRVGLHSHSEIMREVFFERHYFFSALLSEMSEMTRVAPVLFHKTSADNNYFFPNELPVLMPRPLQMLQVLCFIHNI